MGGSTRLAPAAWAVKPPAAEPACSPSGVEDAMAEGADGAHAVCTVAAAASLPLDT